MWEFAEQYPGKWAAIVAVNPQCTPNYVNKVPRVPCWIFEESSATTGTNSPVHDFALALADRKEEARYTEYSTLREVWGDELFSWLALKAKP